MLNLQYELCWQIGVEHPDMLERKLTMPQMCGWIAWMQRRPRGDRHLESVLAIQTAHLRSAWVEGDEDASRFLPKWSESSGPANAVEMELMQFGSAYRI